VNSGPQALPVDALRSTGQPVDVRHADPGRDAVDGVLPRLVVVPRTPEAVAAVLAWASSERLSVLVRGGGSKFEWGRPPDRFDVLLETRALDRVIAHSRGDLTATVEAGVTLRELNGALAADGQHLPIDPLFGAGATVGGLLATNDSGPLRHRFGTPRDLVIGIRLATADGRLVKAGGQVVKNVAGYDLSKLVSGSFGSVAAVVSATFKLAPVPSASATIVVEAPDRGAFHRAVGAIQDSQLEPMAFEVHARREPHHAGLSARCLVRFAAVPQAVDAAVSECRGRVSAFGLDVPAVTGGDESRVWAAHTSRVCRPDAAVLRVGWLPADLARVLEIVQALPSSLDAELVGRIQAGAGALALGGATAEAAGAIATIRRSGAVGGVVQMRGSPELKRMVDVWGDVPNLRLLKAVKAAVDPHGVLGANRGPL
jgi:glycolate oxidase FAD binding subunit